MGQKGLVVGLGGAALILAGVAGGYYLAATRNAATESGKAVEEALPPAAQLPAPAADLQTPSPKEAEEGGGAPSDWQTYKSLEYGFEISYPSAYKALDDEENLYGWPNGVVLFYKGGQSYDIAIEVWDSPSQYESKYPSGDFLVEKIGDKYVTVADMTGEEGNADIISTFKATR